MKKLNYKIKTPIKTIIFHINIMNICTFKIQILKCKYFYLNFVNDDKINIQNRRFSFQTLQQIYLFIKVICITKYKHIDYTNEI